MISVMDYLSSQKLYEPGDNLSNKPTTSVEVQPQHEETIINESSQRFL